MRKRSKKRIPQDVKPWVRVKEVDIDVFSLPGKKTTRWVAGGRFDWDTKILNAAALNEVKAVLLRSFIITTGTASNDLSKNLLNKLNYRLHIANKVQSLTRYKNYCALSGRARTYNRSLYIARHIMRELVGTGQVSGLIK